MIANNPAAYRADIDGLRALAVLSVILYHLEVPGFSGGFIGVDIFFVISGYLITRNIVSEQHRGEWSFSRFYARRARRLFPALFFTICISFIFAFLLFTPRHFSSFSQSLLYTSVLLPNVFFWLDTGYFSLSAQFKPLLHFWSLGVEEQFYLFWPVLLIVLMKFSARLLVTLILFIVILSMYYSEYWLNIDTDAAFYLLPFRGFEFAIGGLLPFLDRFRVHHPYVEDILLFVALATIAIIICTYDDNTAYPGINALIPCLAAALIIFSGQAPVLGRILRHKTVVGIGLISYSLYLIHWPVLVFYKYRVLHALLPVEQIGIVIISLIVAIGMYRWVEQPFRFNRTHILSTAGFGSVCLALALFIVFSTAHVWASDGWPWRVDNWAELTEARKTLLHPDMRCEPRQLGSNCVFGENKPGKEDILIIGDSHSQSLWSGIDYLAKKNRLKVRGWYSGGCPPIFNIRVKLHDEKSTKDCNELIQRWAAYIHQQRPKIIIIAARWTGFFELKENYVFNDRRITFLLLNKNNPVYSRTASRQVFARQLALTIDEITNQGSKLIVFSQAPELGVNPWHCSEMPSYMLSLQQKEKLCQFVSYDKLISRLAFTDATIMQLTKHKQSVMPVIMKSFFCDEKSRSCQFFKNNQPLYKDFNHLNRAGSRYIAQKIEGEFARFLQSR